MVGTEQRQPAQRLWASVAHGAHAALAPNLPEGQWQSPAPSFRSQMAWAGFYGSLGNLVRNRPVCGIVATPSGEGYWLVATGGGVFNFGDAGFYEAAA